MKFLQAVKAGLPAIRRPTWPQGDKVVIEKDTARIQQGGRPAGQAIPVAYWKDDKLTDWEAA